MKSHYSRQYLLHTFNVLAIALFSVFIPKGHASSMQPLSVQDGDSITVKISSREITRIGIAGEGRLDKIWGASGIMEVSPDTDNGEVFIKPLAGAPGTFSFFIRDDAGATYTLVATQHDIPSQTIMLRPSNLRQNSLEQARWQNQPFIENVKSLMKAMALGEAAAGYQIEVRQSRVPLWRETDIRQVRAYVGFALLGEIYVVTNRTGEVIRFHEREFMDFGEAVSAVALERLEVEPGGSTTLFVVRQTPSEG